MHGRKQGKAVKYVCGLYTTTAGSQCEHNTVPVQWLSEAILRVVRQSILLEELRPALEKRIRAIAEASSGPRQDDDRLAGAMEELRTLEAQLDRVKMNLAIAHDEKTFAAVEEIFKGLDAKADAKRQEVDALREKVSAKPNMPVEERIERAMSLLDHLDELAEQAHGPEFNRLINALDLRVWARFQKVQQGKRLLNKFAHGTITTGDAPWPINPYTGPRDRPSAKKKKADMRKSAPIRSSDRTGADSLQKVHRRALTEFEHVPAGFLNWFLVPSLQRNVLAELVADLAACETRDGLVAAYA